MGVSKLMDLLSDSREIIRNDVSILDKLTGSSVFAFKKIYYEIVSEKFTFRFA